MCNIFLFFQKIYIIDHGQAKASAEEVFLIYQLCSTTFVFKNWTFSPCVCYFFCSGSLAIDPVDGTLNYVIALLLSPIVLCTVPSNIYKPAARGR
jgi:hypothetical protein